VIEHHSFKLPVRVEAHYFRYEIVHRKHHDCYHKIGFANVAFRKAVRELSSLHLQTQLVEVPEEVHGYVENVDDEAAVVHLGESAEQDGDVNHFVHAGKHVHEADHDAEAQVHESADHQLGPMASCFLSRGHNGLTHVVAAAESKTHIIFLYLQL